MWNCEITSTFGYLGGQGHTLRLYQTLVALRLSCRLAVSKKLTYDFSDCKTDVFFNTASLLFPLLGHLLNVWWLDPVGAGLLSLYIIYDWADTCVENVNRLTGAAVPDRLWQKLMLLAYRFSPVVDGYKSLTAYHAGDGVWVEIDIIMDENEKLHRAHDVAETLQYCCEGLSWSQRSEGLLAGDSRWLTMKQVLEKLTEHL